MARVPFRVALQTQERAGEFTRSTLHLDKEEPRKSGEIGLHSQAEINLVFLVRQMSAMSEV